MSAQYSAVESKRLTPTDASRARRGRPQVGVTLRQSGTPTCGHVRVTRRGWLVFALVAVLVLFGAVQVVDWGMSNIRHAQQACVQGRGISDLDCAAVGR